MIIRLITGRFQPFHNGHLEYAVEAAQGADLLIVGLTRAFDRPPNVDEIPEHRMSDDHNPLSLAERAAVVLSALGAEPRIDAQVAVTLVPIEQPQWLTAFVPTSWQVVLTLHEQWNERKRRIFEEAGYHVRIACVGMEKTIHGRDIRALMRAGDESWRKQVPKGAAETIDRLGLADAMRND